VSKSGGRLSLLLCLNLIKVFNRKLTDLIQSHSKSNLTNDLK